MPGLAGLISCQLRGALPGTATGPTSWSDHSSTTVVQLYPSLVIVSGTSFWAHQISLRSFPRMCSLSHDASGKKCHQCPLIPAYLPRLLVPIGRDTAFFPNAESISLCWPLLPLRVYLRRLRLRVRRLQLSFQIRSRRLRVVEPLQLRARPARPAASISRPMRLATAAQRP